LSPKLEPKAAALGGLGKKKLFEFMTEDDEDLLEISDCGTIAGISLDDIDSKTTPQLKPPLPEPPDSISSVVGWVLFIIYRFGDCHDINMFEGNTSIRAAMG
ncbi:hypothetical protein ACVGWK_24455, partial [Enterobacter sichuanensis]